MLLGYEYESLLVNKENKSKVAQILKDLDFDVSSPDFDAYRDSLLSQLEELGEHTIYQRLVEQFSKAS